MIQSEHTLPVLPDSAVLKSIPQIDIASLKNLSWSEVADTAVQGLIDFALHLVVAIIVFVLGRFIIRRINAGIKALMLRRNADRSLTTFILSLVRMVLLFILVIIVIGILGVNTSSFIALFASAGIAIGMALSGTLQNFAGGVLILLLKPYKIGDYIEAQGYEGYVTDIQIFHTVISTYDNKSIIVPNGPLANGSINNYSREKFRRVEWKVNLHYGVDFANARKVILEILSTDKRIIREGDPAEFSNETESVREEGKEKKLGFFSRLYHRRREKMKEYDSKLQALSLIPRVHRLASVSLNALDDSSIDVRVRAWTEGQYYWPVYYEILERIYTELPKRDIQFPYPQLDVHLDK